MYILVAYVRFCKINQIMHRVCPEIPIYKEETVNLKNHGS